MSAIAEYNLTLVPMGKSCKVFSETTDLMHGTKMMDDY